MSDDMNTPPEQPVEPATPLEAPRPAEPPAAAAPDYAAPSEPTYLAAPAAPAAPAGHRHRWVIWAVAVLGVLLVLAIGTRVALGLHRAVALREFRRGYAAAAVQHGGWYGRGRLPGGGARGSSRL
jgi:hypothetical protein